MRNNVERAKEDQTNTRLGTRVGAERIGLQRSPHKCFAFWLGIDETKFNAVRVDDLRGQLGTLTLKINRKRVPFDL